MNEVSLATQALTQDDLSVKICDRDIESLMKSETVSFDQLKLYFDEVISEFRQESNQKASC